MLPRNASKSPPGWKPNTFRAASGPWAILLHGEEKTVNADAGYIGVEKRAEIIAKHGAVEWPIAARRSKIKALPESWVKDLTLGFEKLKARARALVEPFGPELMAEGHPFHIVKNLFKHRKVRYRGMKKNTAQLHTLFALANLVVCQLWSDGNGERISWY